VDGPGECDLYIRRVKMAWSSVWTLFKRVTMSVHYYIRSTQMTSACEALPCVSERIKFGALQPASNYLNRRGRDIERFDDSFSGLALELFTDRTGLSYILRDSRTDIKGRVLDTRSCLTTGCWEPGTKTLRVCLPLKLAHIPEALLHDLGVDLSFSLCFHAPTGRPYAVMAVWPATHLAYLRPTHVSGVGDDALFTLGTGLPSADGLLFEKTLLVRHGVTAYGYACVCPWEENMFLVQHSMRLLAGKVFAPFDSARRLSNLNFEHLSNVVESTCLAASSA
jgi:hypothetical protein